MQELQALRTVPAGTPTRSKFPRRALKYYQDNLLPPAARFREISLISSRSPEVWLTRVTLLEYCLAVNPLSYPSTYLSLSLAPSTLRCWSDATSVIRCVSTVLYIHEYRTIGLKISIYSVTRQFWCCNLDLRRVRSSTDKLSLTHARELPVWRRSAYSPHREYSFLRNVLFVGKVSRSESNLSDAHVLKEFIGRLRQNYHFTKAQRYVP